MRGVISILLYGLVWGGSVVLLGSHLVTIPILVLFELPILIPLLWLTFAGADKRASKAQKALSLTLMDDETIIASGIQHRAFALWKRRTLLAITVSRIIVLQRGRLGGFTMQDIQWKDLQDVTIRENILPSLCGTDMRFAHSAPSVGPIYVPGIIRDVAFKIYGHSQREEQSWEEKRRVRAIEEVRAASGGLTLPSVQQPASYASPETHRMFDELARARQLLDAGTISDAEFQEMKAKILAKL